MENTMKKITAEKLFSGCDLCKTFCIGLIIGLVVTAIVCAVL